jgi:hypothetical protein
MKNIIISVVTSIIVVVIALVLVGGNQSATSLGGTTNFNDLVLAKDNGATSTISVGCVQTLATSSATSIKLTFLPVATTTGNGFTVWSYGTCP